MLFAVNSFQMNAVTFWPSFIDMQAFADGVHHHNGHDDDFYNDNYGFQMDDDRMAVMIFN